MRTRTGENPIYLDSPGSGSGSTLEFPVLSVCLGFIKPLSVWFSKSGSGRKDRNLLNYDLPPRRAPESKLVCQLSLPAAAELGPWL